MTVTIYSDDGLVEFPVSHVSVSIDGAVHLMGDTADGRPFSVAITGLDGDGRDFAGTLAAVRDGMLRAYDGESGR